VSWSKVQSWASLSQVQRVPLRAGSVLSSSRRTASTASLASLITWKASKLTVAWGRCLVTPGKVGAGQVDAHLLDGLRVAAMGTKVGGEGRHGALVAALAGEQQASARKVMEQADVVLSTPGSGLVQTWSS
jgi:hypothetical protein